MAEVEIPDGARLIFDLRGIPVVLAARTLESGHPPATVQDRLRKVEILVDRTSIESFVNDGEISSTRFAIPKASGLSVKAEGGAVTLHSLTLFRLDSAWTLGDGE